MKSSKKYISEYICLKILKGSYVPGDLIYSEHKLAIKFNCSRLTARSALVVLVNAGILSSKKGKGYVVTPNALNILFYAKKLFIQGNNHKFTKISDLNIKTLFNAENTNYDLYEIKTFKDDEILSISYIAINKKAKDLEKFIEADPNFSIDTITKLIETGFIPNNINNSYEIKEVLPIQKSDLEKLGYVNSFVPYIKQTMYDNNEEVAYFVYSVSTKTNHLFSVTTTLLLN